MATAISRSPVRPRSLFGEILRRELEAQGVSVKELSRRLARRSGGKPEAHRRLLQKYISGDNSPTQPSRDAIAEELGIDSAVFADEALQLARRRRIAEALMPLADVLLEIATAARDHADGGKQ